MINWKGFGSYCSQNNLKNSARNFQVGFEENEENLRIVDLRDKILIRRLWNTNQQCYQIHHIFWPDQRKDSYKIAFSLY